MDLKVESMDMAHYFPVNLNILIYHFVLTEFCRGPPPTEFTVNMFYVFQGANSVTVHSNIVHCDKCRH